MDQDVLDSMGHPLRVLTAVGAEGAELSPQRSLRAPRLTSPLYSRDFNHAVPGGWM